MTTLHNADPMTVYLLIDGEEPVAVPGIVDFNLTVENPEVHEERDDARRVNPRRAQQLRRRRRANPGDLNLTLDYDPCDWVHQELLAAGEADVRLTLRFAVRDGAGQAVSAQDVDCSVLRYNISLHKRNRRRPNDDGRPYVFEADLRLQRHGDFRDVDVARAD
jgi:hypothetical protein